MIERTQLAVEVRDLVKVYPRPGGGMLRALHGISFEVAAGEFFGFLGPNGAGKTTALEIIEGIRKPTSGEVRVLGIDPRWELDKVKRVMGVQLQAASYLSLLTIEEILDLFGSFYPKRRSPAELLETVGLLDKRKAYVRQLSGGQQRRFSVAAALVNDPQVIFLDEPTTGLDPHMRHSLWELLRRLNQEEGKTIVLTTHYMEEAELLAERVAILDQGQIRAIDTPRALIAGLDGMGHIEFAASQAVDTSELAGLSGVAGAVAKNGSNFSGRLGPATYELAVTEPKTAVTALLHWAEGSGAELRGLEVVPGTLEDVFLQLTGRELRE
ncbi:MAG TPA: ABC transporter ATP-binding protein [Anaerolineales bacterium]|jgi:ABC-2 type transport system ATP-binding protein|nr:ABC transporter ATP-binding protein [Anaerolineales bacterium]